MLKLVDVLGKEVYCNSNVSLTGVWGQSPQPPEAIVVWGEAPSRRAFFCSFLKKSCFNAIGSHFARIQSHLKILDFEHLKAK